MSRTIQLYDQLVSEGTSGVWGALMRVCGCREMAELLARVGLAPVCEELIDGLFHVGHHRPSKWGVLVRPTKELAGTLRRRGWAGPTVTCCVHAGRPAFRRTGASEH